MHSWSLWTISNFYAKNKYDQSYGDYNNYLFVSFSYIKKENLLELLTAVISALFDF